MPAPTAALGRYEPLTLPPRIGWSVTAVIHLCCRGSRPFLTIWVFLLQNNPDLWAMIVCALCLFRVVQRMNFHGSRPNHHSASSNGCSHLLKHFRHVCRFKRIELSMVNPTTSRGRCSGTRKPSRAQGRWFYSQVLGYARQELGYSWSRAVQIGVLLYSTAR